MSSSVAGGEDGEAEGSGGAVVMEAVDAEGAGRTMDGDCGPGFGIAKPTTPDDFWISDGARTCDPDGK